MRLPHAQPLISRQKAFWLALALKLSSAADGSLAAAVRISASSSG